jgi:hypothetical protein
MISADVHVSSGTSNEASKAQNATTVLQRGPDPSHVSAVSDSEAQEYAGAAASIQAARVDQGELPSDEYAIIGGFAECVLM